MVGGFRAWSSSKKSLFFDFMGQPGTIFYFFFVFWNQDKKCNKMASSIFLIPHWLRKSFFPEINPRNGHYQKFRSCFVFRESGVQRYNLTTATRLTLRDIEPFERLKPP
jgi:hypothetical protein